MNREFDIVVFGATGFTGGMTAQYLARHAPADVRWAIAGRSQSKLQALKSRLVAIDPRCEQVGVIEASVDDFASLQRMAASTRVLLTTVGPFIDYGEPVVRACLEARTDYLDSTGEPFFVERLVARYSALAAQNKVRIVPSCGFDSIPADLGALFTVEQLPPDQPIALRGYLSLRAKFSGGTERSALKSLVPPPDADQLPPPSAANGRRVRLVTSKAEKQPALGGWSSPLPTLDGSVVLRSAASLDRFGPDFSYSHNVVHASFAVMVLAGIFFGTLSICARIPALRALFLRMAKPSGTGPSEADLDRGWFKLRFIAKSGGKTLQTEVSGGEPAYRETSKILSESALCLARDALPPRAGVLTPAEAMGDNLIARLQRAGLQFRVLESTV